ncbi:MAG TPA: transposase zinc-binding domain-containing protein, partial [Polyangiaceae bacterium]
MVRAAHCPPSSNPQRPSLEVADIVRLHGEPLRQSRSLSREQERVLGDIARCRTAELGGHLDVCESCGLEKPSYNSCRNRHCPKCQALSQARWLEGRRRRILPAPVTSLEGDAA